MLLDYNSILLSIGFSALCLSAILFATWCSTRADGVLLTWSVAALLIVANVLSYGLYVEHPRSWLAVAAFASLLAGLSTLLGAARQFRLDVRPLRRIVLAIVVSMGIALPPFAIGYDGIGFMLANLAAAVLLTLTAGEYMRARHEAPSAIAGITGLYLFVALSFALCAIALAIEGKPVLDGPPSNWAEDLNLVAVIVGVAGIGAMSLALNQTRLARIHKHEAMTDPLTGLLNRRALFDRFGTGPMQENFAVIVFDIDHFKRINDAHGHSIGDDVIARFARALREELGEGMCAARLGGEEFVLVVPRASMETALRHAERVRAGFAAATRREHGLECSACAGVAFSEMFGASFQSVLSAADEALYQAKHGGRDRIATTGLRLAADAGVKLRSFSRP
ncbi:GGDEF domain-containing protein [Ancylobacter terrae]|uniref:GGDEF domain-containing protein n=1 Tax=Ancylobacter sp. sgz301288 TaxID=3342077 RepID=UPI003858B532